MSLPFLNPKRIASIVIAKTKKDGSVDAGTPEHEAVESPSMEMAEEMISAMHAKDAVRLAALIDSLINKSNTSNKD